jgi:hypothetical protein
MAQVLGFAIFSSINNMVCSDDCNKYLGKCLGGLESHCDGFSMDNNDDKTTLTNL